MLEFRLRLGPVRVKLSLKLSCILSFKIEGTEIFAEITDVVKNLPSKTDKLSMIMHLPVGFG